VAEDEVVEGRRVDREARAVGGLRKPATTSVLAAAGLTTIPVWLPVIELVTVSVALIDRLPAVLRVALKVWAPASAPMNV
jgi:hypothetical protein